MIVLGLTGSIGMGKSFVAEQFSAQGVPVFDADAEVHKLLSPQGAAFKKVARQFPQALENNSINRKRLGSVVFHDKEKLRALEAIIHPLIRDKEEAFIQSCRQRQEPLIVLDIPLLFETGADTLCDKVLVVHATPEVQKERVLSRGHVDSGQYEAIRKLQLGDEEKLKRADYVLHTEVAKDEIIRQVKDLIFTLKGKTS